LTLPGVKQDFLKETHEEVGYKLKIDADVVPVYFYG
jgi:hypothetical protein